MNIRGKVQMKSKEIDVPMNFHTLKMELKPRVWFAAISLVLYIDLTHSTLQLLHESQNSLFKTAHFVGTILASICNENDAVYQLRMINLRYHSSSSEVMNGALRLLSNSTCSRRIIDDQYREPQRLFTGVHYFVVFFDTSRTVSIVFKIVCECGNFKEFS